MESSTTQRERGMLTAVQVAHRQMVERTTEQLRQDLARIDAKHYFNWSNADQVDRMLIQRELEKRN